MSQSSYNSIKKYAAFLFMVFTVLSSSSEGFEDYGCLKAGGKAFFDILLLNRLAIQDSRVTISRPEDKYASSQDEDLRNFLDVWVEALNPDYIQVYSIPLIVPVFYLVDFISKNSIWRSAVF